MVNNNRTKKGGSWYNPFSSNETIDSCKAKCDSKFAPVQTASAPAESKGMFSWFPSFGKKEEEAKQPLMTNQHPSNMMGGKRPKGSKKTRKNKKRKGTRKSSQ